MRVRAFDKRRLSGGMPGSAERDGGEGRVLRMLALLFAAYVVFLGLAVYFGTGRSGAPAL